jgi:hypothetical protein
MSALSSESGVPSLLLSEALLAESSPSEHCPLPLQMGDSILLAETTGMFRSLSSALGLTTDFGGLQLANLWLMC